MAWQHMLPRHFNEKLVNWDKMHGATIKIIMKIRSVGVELLHADRQKDRQTDKQTWSD
jgi:hypothetical protein